MAALFAVPAAAQTPTTTSTSQTAITQDEIVLQGDTTPRPAMPTIEGDTGFWAVPTAETLPTGKMSFSVFRANSDRRQGLTDVNMLGLTAAVGLKGHVEVFGAWHLVRTDRDVIPTFVASDPEFGGVSQEFPYLRRGWSKNLGGPLTVGAKWNLISQSRGDSFSLAPRVVVEIPVGAEWSSTNEIVGRFGLVGSREFGKTVFSGTAGAVLRRSPDEFDVSDGISWGLGASFPTRTRLRALVEWTGEFVIDQNAAVIAVPYVAEDGSIAPVLSPIVDPTYVKVGAVWSAKNGMFIHGGVNYSLGTSGRVVNGFDIDHSAWGLDVSLGWHPGVTPARERIRQIKETTTVTNTITPPPPPPANRNPAFSVNATCDPSTVEPGGATHCTAQATDPDGDAVSYRWTAPSGTFAAGDTAASTWTAGENPGPVALTVTASDTRGGTATSSVTVQVIKRVELVFEDVHFDFDRFNLKPEALKLLDDAVAKLTQNPNVRITIEGHCDSIGTSEYNLALGEKRANSVRDYLSNRGVADTRLRTVSYGEDRPLETNNTAQGRAANRRAHLVVIVETLQ